jgi:3D (Asp-Asp-Asp) domain-containing protein
MSNKEKVIFTRSYKKEALAVAVIAFASLAAGYTFQGCSTTKPDAVEVPSTDPKREKPSPAILPSGTLCCESVWPGTKALSQNTVTSTSYYPANSRMEGGFNDKIGKPLRTLQSFLNGQAEYVSVAMDKTIAYGTKVCIPELNVHFGKPIKFKVVDTGGAFYGKGKTRIDVCSANYKTSIDPWLNRKLTLVWCGNGG